MSRLLFIVSIIFIFYGTLIPFQFVGNMEHVIANLHRVNWIPFWDVSRGRLWSVPDMVQNILLFMPFGVFGYLTIRKPYLIITLGLLISATCEALQLLTMDRFSGVTDVATNTAGAATGILIAMLIESSRKRMERIACWRRAARLESFRLMVVLFGMCAVLFYEPFDFTLDVGSIWPKVKYLLLVPFKITPISSEPLYVGIFAMLSISACNLLKSLDPARSISPFWVAVFSGAFGLMLELSQFIVASRMPALQDALSNVSGALLGVFVCQYWKRMPQRWRLYLFVASFTLILAVMELSPFKFTAHGNGFNFVPFLPYYARTNAIALSDSIEMLFLGTLYGLGIVWVSRPWKNARAFVCQGIALFIVEAAACEYLQHWVIDRYPDITDVLLVGLGTVMGGWLYDKWIIPEGSGQGTFEETICSS